MDYTSSDAYVTHVGTGHRMHEDSNPIPTAVTDKDLNMLIWSLMEFLAAAGIAPASFDPNTPASYRKLYDSIFGRLTHVRTVKDYGALGAGADESVQAAAMLAAENKLVVPAGFTLVAKNLALLDNCVVQVDGCLKLPSGCSDFDRLLYAVNRSGIQIRASEIDGNAAGQAGNIGTHLIYLVNPVNCTVDVVYAHNHYVASGATMPAVDGVRNTSSGAIFLSSPIKCRVNVDLLSGWGREGVYLIDSTFCDVWLKHAEGTGNTEYSGLQVSGSYSHVHQASVTNAGASGVGFDTKWGTLSNVTCTNIRANNGVNVGHPGRPATGAVLNNITVNGCYASGIGVQSSSEDVNIANATISNAGTYGISFSDGVTRGKVSNAVVANSGRANLNAVGTEVGAMNVASGVVDANSLTATTVTGAFVEGESVSTGTGSGVARRVLKNLTGSEQVVFVPTTTGTFTVGQTLTGATSGATATLTRVDTPTQYNEASGGTVAESSRYLAGAVGNQIRLLDGSAMYSHGAAFAATAGVLGTLTLTFSSNVQWAAAPVVTVTIASASSTSAYTVQTLQASATTVAATIRIKTDVTQTYGINVVAVGRWK